MAEFKTSVDIRSSVRWGYLNRTFGEIGKALADPTIVFSLFVRQLGASNFLVGLLSTIRYGGWFLPQLAVAGRVQHRRRRGPVYVFAELSRCLGYLAIAALILAMPNSRLLLPIFFVLFGLSYLGHGVGSVPRFDVIGRAVPAGFRGTYFARANLLAGVFGFGAGFLVQALLRSGAHDPPIQRFAWLILLSVVFYIFAVGAFTRIRERDSIIAKEKARFGQTLRGVPRMLRGNPAFRRLVTTLVLSDAARRVADPFYVIFATEVLGSPVYVAGLYVSTLVVSKIIANLIWDPLSRRFGNRLILQLATLATFGVPVLALGFAWFRPTGATAGIAFAGAYVLMGFRDSGKYVGKRAVFLDLIPEEGRPLHWGALNTLLGAVTFLPMVAGTMIDRMGFLITFGGVAAVALIALWSSLGVREVPAVSP